MSMYLPKKKTSHEKLVKESIIQLKLEEMKKQNTTNNGIEKGTFSELYPDLLVDWDFEKNNINPAEIASGTKVIVNWKCNKCNYEWEARVDKRCTGRSICKQCRWRVIERDARLRKK